MTGFNQEYRAQVSDPYISIYIPTFQRQEKLVHAIKSALDQRTDCPYEIVVVDNDPDRNAISDDVRRLCESSDKISYYKNEENIGMFRNWNRAIELCKGELCCALHDDDALLPNYVSTVRGIASEFHFDELHFVARPEAVGMKGKIRKGILQRKGNFRRKIDPRAFLIVDGLSPCGAVFRKDFFLGTDGFDPAFYPSADMAYTVLALQDADILVAGDEVAIYNYEDNCSSSAETRSKFFDQNIKIRELLQRRYPHVYTSFRMKGITRNELRTYGPFSEEKEESKYGKGIVSYIANLYILGLKFLYLLRI